MAQRFPCWWVKGCPLEASCSPQSWKRTRSCTSWESEDEARDLLRHHLQTSSNHQDIDGDDAALEQAVLAANVVYQEVEWSEQQQQKKQRAERKLHSQQQQQQQQQQLQLEQQHLNEERITNIAAKAAMQAAMGMATSSASSSATQPPPQSALSLPSALTPMRILPLLNPQLDVVKGILIKANQGLQKANALSLAAARAFQQQSEDQGIQTSQMYAYPLHFTPETDSIIYIAFCNVSQTTCSSKSALGRGLLG